MEVPQLFLVIVVDIVCEHTVLKSVYGRRIERAQEKGRGCCVYTGH